MINNNFRRILIFNVNWLGDVIFTIPAIRALHKQYPESFIACVAPERCREVLELNPYINEVISFDERKTHKSIPSKLEFIQLLKSKKFDTVFLFHRSFTRLFLVTLSGIKRRIGLDRKKFSFLLTYKIPFIERDSVHRVDYFMNIVKPFCSNVSDKTYELKIDIEDILFTRRLLEEARIKKTEDFIVLNPGANWIFKRWPVENFALLCDFVKTNFKTEVVISGSEVDMDLAKEIYRLTENKPVVLCGKTNLKQLAALFKMSKLVVSADSGPLHIAIASGTRTVSLFGPTSAKITGPYDLEKNVVIQKTIDCQVPCYEVKCFDSKCMWGITPEEVLEAIKKLNILVGKS